MAKSKDKTTLFIIAGGFLAMGLFVTLYFGLPTLKLAKSSGSWPKTSGVVMQSSIETKRSSSHRRGRRSRTSYSPKIQFEYTVDGKQYSSDQLNASGEFFAGRGKAQEVVDNYKRGKQVDVFYSPADPNVAMLEPGLTGGSFVVFGVGVLFSVVGLGLGAMPFFNMVSK